MHSLTRQVRFSINPFLSETHEGYNSYASRPCGEGLSLYFGLWVELVSQLDDATGFVVNVVDIDKAVRKHAVPIFHDQVSQQYKNARHISLTQLCDILKSIWRELENEFEAASLNRISLDLNPFRKITIKSETCEMIHFSEKFEFAATHKLWNDKFDEQQNFQFFGKCANPNGHGHNYVVEVTVERAVSEERFFIGQFGKTVKENFIEKVDHKNLNVDVPIFSRKNPTVENIAVFAWDSLVGKFPYVRLKCITAWESDKTFCSYCGPDDTV